MASWRGYADILLLGRIQYVVGKVYGPVEAINIARLIVEHPLEQRKQAGRCLYWHLCCWSFAHLMDRPPMPDLDPKGWAHQMINKAILSI